MGGPSGGSGGGEGPRNQYKKKSTLQKIIEKSAVLNVVKKAGTALEDAARPYNTKKRKEFISKYNTSVPPTERLNMTDKEIGSAKGLASLKNIGYRTAADTSSDRDGPKSIEQPKVASQMDNTDVKSKLVIADKTSPTDVEMNEDERMIGVKRKGRRTTMLTDIKENKKPTLSKKVLLG